jgi:hypothetical protein
MMKRFLAVFLCALIAAPACATSRGPRLQTAPIETRGSADRAVLAEFAKQLPLGTRVRARTDDRTIRGTLLKVTDTSVFVQPRTRLAEPLQEITFNQLLALEQDIPGSGNAGRTAAIAAAAAAGATLGVLLILAAIFSD